MKIMDIEIEDDFINAAIERNREVIRSEIAQQYVNWRLHDNARNTVAAEAAYAELNTLVDMLRNINNVIYRPSLSLV